MCFQFYLTAMLISFFSSVQALTMVTQQSGFLSISLPGNSLGDLKMSQMTGSDLVREKAGVSLCPYHYYGWQCKSFSCCNILYLWFLPQGRKASEQEESQKQKMLKGMKKQLKHMLSQPLFKVLMKTKYPTQSGKLLLPQTSVSYSALGAVSKKQAKKKQSIK